MLVRDASAADAAAIEGVARRSWTETYRGIFQTSFIDEFVARNYAPAQLAAAATAAAQSEDAHFLVAERGGEAVGFAQFGSGPRGPELFRIYAHPEHYGTGIGSALLRELHRRLEGRIESYLVDVHAKNVRGRAFYERQGFVPGAGGATDDGHLTLRKVLHRRTSAERQDAGPVSG